MPMQEKSVQKKARSQSSKRPGDESFSVQDQRTSIERDESVSEMSLSALLKEWNKGSRRHDLVRSNRKLCHRPKRFVQIRAWPYRRPPTVILAIRRKIECRDWLFSIQSRSLLVSAFPCFRFCGPIKCPSNKLPMPRDLWYRIVCSQALETQIGQRLGGWYLISLPLEPSRLLAAQLPVPSKRKLTQGIWLDSVPWRASPVSLSHRNIVRARFSQYVHSMRLCEKSLDCPEENKSNANHSSRQQTMNAAASFTSFKMLKLSGTIEVTHQSHPPIILN